VNAASRDELSAADTGTGDVYTLRALPKQNVVLRVEGFVDGDNFEFFYLNSSDLDHATVVRIPQRGTITINIALPAPS
jgi:hypothetical protein